MTEKETDGQMTDITIGFVQCGIEKPPLRLTVFGVVAVTSLSRSRVPALQIGTVREGNQDGGTGADNTRKSGLRHVCSVCKPRIHYLW